MSVPSKYLIYQHATPYLQFQYQSTSCSSMDSKPSPPLPYIPATTTLIPGLYSTVGITDFSALCPVVGVQSTKTKSLVDEYIAIETFLLNLQFAPYNAHLQTYVDNAGPYIKSCPTIIPSSLNMRSHTTGMQFRHLTCNTEHHCLINW